jgi:hypothetical protein
MGAWGTGFFEDDGAFDFTDEIESSDQPKETIATAFRAAIAADYLERDEANAVIVAATYVDRCVNGTTFSARDDADPLDVDTFPERRPDQDLSGLRELAVHALHQVTGDHSELKELWAETDEFEAWQGGIEQLIERLSC